MSKPEVILKIKVLQNSNVGDYFETNERMFLVNTLSELENERSQELSLSEDQMNLLQKIYEKYKKYL